MKYGFFFLFSLLILQFPKLTGQELMPQGVFLQTCSPVFGEKYIFEGIQFSYFSEELGLFGQGTYMIKRNRLFLHFNKELHLPAHCLSYKNETPGETRKLIVNLFGPGDFKNQVGVKIEIYGTEHKFFSGTDTPVVDSYTFKSSQLPVEGEIKILHPTDGEFIIPFSFKESNLANLVVWFKNNWEPVPHNTRNRYKLENIRASSFLIEKTLVRKTYFCVFIRQDQAERMMEQIKQQ